MISHSKRAIMNAVSINDCRNRSRNNYIASTTKVIKPKQRNVLNRGGRTSTPSTTTAANTNNDMNNNNNMNNNMNNMNNTFIPAHERRTLSKIVPAKEGTASNGLKFREQTNDFQLSFRRLLAFEFMEIGADDASADSLVEQITVLNIDPPIFTVDDFITKEECDSLIVAAKASGGLKVSAIGGGQKNENIRTSKTVALNSSTGLQEHRTKMAILAKAERLFPDIKGLSIKKNAFKAPQAGRAEWAYELPQVAYYQGGEYFKAHEDAFPISIAEEKGYQRRATVLVYLNDVPSGGCTRFEHLELDVKPEKGKCLVFFPSTVAAMPDPRTLHTATEAENGHEKWVSQLWVSHSTPSSFSSSSSISSQSEALLANAANNKKGENRAQRRIREREEAKAERKKN